MNIQSVYSLTKQLRSRGFAIVAAIFLLVVLSALGGFMLVISGSQQIASAQDVQGTRAYFAAKAGIQWAATQINSTSACAAATLSLDGFSIAVTCTSHAYTEGANSRTIYWVQSTATTVGNSVGSVGYVERTLNGFIEF
jgi:MSHA biogenesis protein MshP